MEHLSHILSWLEERPENDIFGQLKDTVQNNDGMSG
jgi:hypothetical protein